MTRSEDTIWCDGCGTEILWSPYVFMEKDFCCQNCTYGINCNCGETMDMDDEYREAATSMTTSFPGN